MNDFIFINPNSICSDLCDEIISNFENEPDRCDGLTLSGVNKAVKDTTDFMIPTNSEKWNKIQKCLLKELTKNIEEYINELSKHENYRKTTQHSNDDFKVLNHKNIIFHCFMVQKYLKNVGRYIYHNDSRIVIKDNETRVITYLWYLNDVEEGGETVFWNDYKIKPKKGQLILFPACWTFPHCGKTPISNDKYIITGWLYKKE